MKPYITVPAATSRVMAYWRLMTELSRVTNSWCSLSTFTSPAKHGVGSEALLSRPQRYSITLFLSSAGYIILSIHAPIFSPLLLPTLPIFSQRREDNGARNDPLH